jgi:curved DNA-binding protein CbpA
LKPHYETLGVSENASQEEIKKAYQRLSKEHHPDKETDPEKIKEATDKQAIINVAYSVLGNAKKRKIYDETGMDGSGKSIEEQAEDILYAMMKEVMKVSNDESSLFRAFHETMAGTIEQLEMERDKLIEKNEEHKARIKMLIGLKLRKGNEKTKTFNRIIDDKISEIKGLISDTAIKQFDEQIIASKRAYDILKRNYKKEPGRKTETWSDWTKNFSINRPPYFGGTTGGPFGY